MIRRRRGAATIAALSIALTVAGCSSSTIDIPSGPLKTTAPTEASGGADPATEPAPMESVAPSEPGAVATPTATEDDLDCESVLPVDTIESTFELPSGFVSAGEGGFGCTWAMAGNPTALVVRSQSGVAPDALAAQQAQGTTEGSEVGDAAFFRAGDPASATGATLVVSVGDRLLSVQSAVGDQEQLETLASDALTALGLDPA